MLLPLHQGLPPEPIRTRNFEAYGHAAVRAYDTHRLDGGHCAVTRLSFTFPLKLLHPRQSSLDALARVRAVRRAQVPAVPSDTSRSASVGAQPAKDRDGNEMMDVDLDSESLSQRLVGKEETCGGLSEVEARANSHLGLGRANPIAALYVAGYGGGLVSGDTVHLDVDVGSKALLLLLTQGSTKVFKKRRADPLSRPSSSQNLATVAEAQQPPSRQTMRFIVRPEASLFVLPDAVTCFENAEYEQVQRIDLRDPDTSSLVLLDWYTAGRTRMTSNPFETAVGSQEGQDKDTKARTDQHSASEQSNVRETWGFERYASRNEVRQGSEVVIRDSMVLDQPPSLPAPLSQPSLAARCAPFGCYATIYLLGPASQGCISSLLTEFAKIQQRPLRAGGSPALLWSISVLGESKPSALAQKSPPLPPPLPRGQGSHLFSSAVLRTAVLRVAGPDADTVRHWFCIHLHPLMLHMGDDLYKQAFGGLP